MDWTSSCLLCPDLCNLWPPDEIRPGRIGGFGQNVFMPAGEYWSGSVWKSVLKWNPVANEGGEQHEKITDECGWQNSVAETCMTETVNDELKDIA